MSRFHKLKVAEITRETPDCVSVVFDVPAALKDEFKYIQGQYLTLKLMVNGEDVRRSYSICSSPVSENELRVAVKKVKAGKGSTFINDVLKVGNEIEVMPPMGNFHTPISAANKKHYVLFAGGSGITPMMSIIKTVLHSEPQSRITLFYGNRDEQSVIFKKQIDDLVAKNSARLNVVHVMENPPAGMDELHKGLLSLDKVKQLVEKYIALKEDNEFFVCGPGPMMDNVKNMLMQLYVDNKKIHIEYFTAATDGQKVATTSAASGEKVNAKVTVILDGEETIFDLSTNGPAVLDAALDAGLDVPFACKGAVCCTCRAKLMEGKVKMDQNFALSDEEVEQGYILTCQSHPLTEKVVVDYDQP